MNNAEKCNKIALWYQFVQSKRIMCVCSNLINIECFIVPKIINDLVVGNYIIKEKKILFIAVSTVGLRYFVFRHITHAQIQ